MDHGSELRHKSLAARDDRDRLDFAYRQKQQILLVRFTQVALQTRDVNALLQRASELCAEGLATKFAKVLEYLPRENRLLMQAGVGWVPGSIGHASLRADQGSPAGYAFHMAASVISNDLETETRFGTPELLREHKIRRAINVLIARGGSNNEPFGILEVDSTDPGLFDESDASFLTGFALLLGIAIERQQDDQKLKSAHERQDLLLKEMSHRVKNSLGVVSGLLRLQARSASSLEARQALEDASSRVVSIAEVHDHLWRSTSVGSVELATF